MAVDGSLKVNTDAKRAAAAETSGACFAIAETPVEFFGNVGGAEIYVKRDDLIPVAHGGNKVRIAAEVFAEMERRGCDAVITYGSVTSNLNRAVALMAQKKGVKCYAIVKRETACGAKPPRNYRLVLSSGAEVAETDGAHVRETVARVIAESKERGEKPFYIYGDETGSGNEEVLSRAYRKVFAEIVKQEQDLFDGEYYFTEIFLAVGTGSTIKGLIEACDKDHHITGISVARTKEKVLAATGPEDERFTVTDEYLAGGYAETAIGKAAGKQSAQQVAEVLHTGPAEVKKTGPAAESSVGCCDVGSLTDFCRTTAAAHDMPLDPVYTGKALWGTLEEIKKRGITGKVLFLHTGGTPLYLDLLESEGK